MLLQHSLKLLLQHLTQYWNILFYLCTVEFNTMQILDKVNPKMITIAREARGMVHAEIAERLKVTKPTAWRLENEHYSINTQTVAQLSDILGFPATFFYQKGELLPLSLSYRKSDTVPAKVMTKIEANINVSRLNIEQLLHSLTTLEINLPVLDVMHYGSAQACSKQLRKLWKLPAGVIENLSEVLEKQNILLLNFDFETEEVDGRGTTALGQYPVIITNKILLGDRQRFTLAYQLGHLVMHLKTSPAYDRDLSHEVKLFAAEFLMPEGDIKKDLSEELTLPKLGELKKKWKVSMQSLVYRANDLQLISDKQKNAILKKFNQQRIRRREPQELDIIPEQYKLVRDLMTKYKTKQKLSLPKMAAFLHLNEDDFLNRYNF